MINQHLAELVRKFTNDSEMKIPMMEIPSSPLLSGSGEVSKRLIASELFHGGPLSGGLGQSIPSCPRWLRWLSAADGALCELQQKVRFFNQYFRGFLHRCQSEVASLSRPASLLELKFDCEKYLVHRDGDDSKRLVRELLFGDEELQNIRKVLDGSVDGCLVKVFHGCYDFVVIHVGIGEDLL